MTYGCAWRTECVWSEPPATKSTICGAKRSNLAWPVAQYAVWPAERGGLPVFVWDEQELADWASGVPGHPLPSGDLEQLGDPLVWIVEFANEKVRTDFAARNGWIRSLESSGVGAAADVPVLAESVPPTVRGALRGERVVALRGRTDLCVVCPRGSDVQGRWSPGAVPQPPGAGLATGSGPRRH